jgi:sugar transferase (PEP-CTERM/EpsH1 system associated)
MHILMLTASLPYPPQQGGALRSYGLLTGMAQAGHRVSLLSLSDQPGQPWQGTPLAEACQHIETVATPTRSKLDRLRDLLLSRDADIARRLWSDECFARLVALVNAGDVEVVLFEGIEVACYLPPLRASGTRARLIYDAFNAEAALQRVIFQVDGAVPKRWPAAAYSFIQAGRIEGYERRLCQQADQVIAVSEEDAAILGAHQSPNPIAVVPNGIFVEQYQRTAERLDLGTNALVFTGKMDYRPNIDAVLWFVQSILPLVRRQVPDATLYVVGQQPHPRIEALRGQPGVEITGWVRDVQPYLRGAAVYVAPLRMGSGTRLKLLEAMACGCTVVATPVARSGMKAAADSVMQVSETPAALADSIIELLRDPARRASYADSARAFVQSHYDWSVLIPDLLKLLAEPTRG